MRYQKYLVLWGTGEREAKAGIEPAGWGGTDVNKFSQLNIGQ
jgi:hypothetical protein